VPLAAEATGGRFDEITVEEIQAAAVHGSIVYVVAATNGGFTLTVAPHGVEWERHELHRRAVEDLLGFSGVAEDRGDLAAIDDVAFPARLEALLEHLGEAVAGPQFTADEDDDRPLVLVPVGRLAVAPLHAARCTVRGRTDWALPFRPLVYAPSAAARVAALRRA
jgi:hypothetical protein